MIATVKVIIKQSFRDSNDYFRNSSTYADIHHLIPLRLTRLMMTKREITRVGADNNEDLEDNVNKRSF